MHQMCTCSFASTCIHHHLSQYMCSGFCCKQPCQREHMLYVSRILILLGTCVMSSMQTPRSCPHDINDSAVPWSEPFVQRYRTRVMIYDPLHELDRCCCHLKRRTTIVLGSHTRMSNVRGPEVRTAAAMASEGAPRQRKHYTQRITSGNEIKEAAVAAAQNVPARHKSKKPFLPQAA